MYTIAIRAQTFTFSSFDDARRKVRELVDVSIWHFSTIEEPKIEEPKIEEPKICPHCKRSFATLHGLEIHIARSHKVLVQ
jgi:hypothetical protein